MNLPGRIVLMVGLAAAGLLGCRREVAFPYALRSPSTGPVYFATQEVVFRLPGGRTERVLTTVENDGERFTIVASTPMGQTLFVLRTRDGGMDLDARVPLPRSLDPRLLPSLIQVCDWPLEEARRGLPPGMELLEAGTLRTLTRRGKPFLVLDRQGSAPPFRTIDVRLPSLGVGATITTLDEP